MEVFRKFLVQSFQTVFVVVEEADAEINRTHIHAHCEYPRHKESKIRNDLQKLVNKYLEGQKMWSMKAVRTTRDRNLIYLCKGKSIDCMPVVLENYAGALDPNEDSAFEVLNDDEIREYHNQYWENQEQSSKKKKNKNAPFLSYVIQMAEESKEFEGIMVSLTRRHRRKMFDIVCHCLGLKHKTLDASIIRRLCNGAFNVIQPLAYRTELLFDMVYDEYGAGT